MLGVDRGLGERRGNDQRGRCQCGDEGLHGGLLRERCRTVRRDIDKISRGPAGTIKLPFRRLNSISWEQVGRAAKAVLSEVWSGSRQETRAALLLGAIAFAFNVRAGQAISPVQPGPAAIANR